MSRSLEIPPVLQNTWYRASYVCEDLCSICSVRQLTMFAGAGPNMCPCISHQHRCHRFLAAWKHLPRKRLFTEAVAGNAPRRSSHHTWPAGVQETFRPRSKYGLILEWFCVESGVGLSDPHQSQLWVFCGLWGAAEALLIFVFMERRRPSSQRN